MVADVKASFEGESFSESAQRSGNKAVRTWTVNGVASASAAKSAAGIPAIDEAHPDDSTYRCDSIVATRPSSALLWKVVANYSEPENSTSHSSGIGTTSSDPLAELPTVEWFWKSITVAIDRDIDNNPIINSAYDPPSDLPSKEIHIPGFTYTRHEEGYDIAKYIKWIDTLNSEIISINGVGNIAAGNLFLETITPAVPIVENVLTVPIRYVFFINPESNLFGFDASFIDKGRRAWYTQVGSSTAVKGLLFTSPTDGHPAEPVSEDILLRGGIPAATGASQFFAGSSMGKGAFDAFQSQSAPSGATVTTTTGNLADRMSYQIYKSMDHRELKL